MLQNFKVLTLVATWQRPGITRICFEGLKRLDVDVLCLVSDLDNKLLCEEFGYDYIEVANSPLGRKMNYGVEKALDRDFDYLMQLGSDDVITNECFDILRSYMQKGYSLFGFNKYHLIDPVRKRAKYFDYKVDSNIGCGRCIKRDVLEESIPLWYDNRVKGMDGNSERTLRDNRVHPTIIPYEKPMIFDIKSDVNLWKFEDVQGEEVDYDKIINLIPEKNVIEHWANGQAGNY